MGDRGSDLPVCDGDAGLESPLIWVLWSSVETASESEASSSSDEAEPERESSNPTWTSKQECQQPGFDLLHPIDVRRHTTH